MSQVLKGKDTGAEVALRKHFADNQISLSATFFEGFDDSEKAPHRQKAKQIYRDVCKHISELTAKSPEVVGQAVCEIFAMDYFTKNTSSILQLLSSKMG